MQQIANKVLLFLLLVSQAFNTAYIKAQDGMLIELKFEPPHGFYDQEIQISITTDTQYSAIHYTLDGSEPAAIINESTLLYQAPIVINKTCCIRAAAILSDGSKSVTLTQTYIFLGDVIHQDYQSTLSAGFPTKWGRFTPDYGMDPDIINDARYRNLIKDALVSLPSISIVMNVDDLFGSNGIYSNSEETGIDWERPGSVELLFPDGTEGFQVNCGIRIQGGWFRQDAGTKKHSFRLLFKSKYGASKLRYPLFGENAADRFDTIVLRAGANDGYAWDAARYTEQYTRDEFGRQLHGWMGNVSPHGMFVHLYLNGVYWGLYNPVERPDNSFSAIYYGGDKSNWDAINSGELDEGNMDAWNLLLSKCQGAVSSIEGYMEILGNNPDGTRNPNFPVLLDIQNYIDYMIVNMWGGNWDWPWKNYRIARDRTETSTGFKFYIWDYENTMGNNRDRSPLNMDRVAGLTTMGEGVAELHINLVKNENYRMLFADRVQKYFFNGGPFSLESLIDHYRELASEVELAIIPESARWGDQHYSTDPLTLDDWYVERDWILNTYLSQRSDIVLDQFRKANLYPAIDAPVFYVGDVAQHGGGVTSADQISISTVKGTVYYTLDGTDPRLFTNSSSNSFIIVPEDMQKHVLVPNGDINQTWKSDAAFDVTNWLLCQGKPGGVGYERDIGYNNYFSLDVEDEMFSKNATCYIRIPFNLSTDLMDSLVSSTLRIRYDDGFIAYLNGTEVARKNFTGNPQWNSNAISQNSDASAVVFENIDISQYLSRLKTGANILAIQGLNISTTSSDFLISAELTGQKKNSNSNPTSVSPNAIEYSEPFALNQTTQIKARVFDGDKWSALNEATFVITSDLSDLIISELHYHPLPLDSIDDQEFEFIELQNTGSSELDLSLCQFIAGIDYVFPVNTLLQPGEYLVLASNRDCFQVRYEFLPFDVYNGHFDNGGERIVLANAGGDTLISFRYNDKSLWPEDADGKGYSLILQKTSKPPDYNNAANWRTSYRLHGSPGYSDTAYFENSRHSLPSEFALRQNYPNPFNSQTQIDYQIPQAANVNISVYNIIGQLVATLVDEVKSPGRYSVNWNSRDQNGSQVSSGIYMARMVSNNYSATIKLILLK